METLDSFNWLASTSVCCGVMPSLFGSRAAKLYATLIVSQCVCVRVCLSATSMLNISDPLNTRHRIISR